MNEWLYCARLRNGIPPIPKPLQLNSTFMEVKLPAEHVRPASGVTVTGSMQVADIEKCKPEAEPKTVEKPVMKKSSVSMLEGTSSNNSVQGPLVPALETPYVYDTNSVNDWTTVTRRNKRSSHKPEVNTDNTSKGCYNPKPSKRRRFMKLNFPIRTGLKESGFGL